MNMYDSLLSPSCLLNEQIARQVFEVLPEDGPIVAIMDTEGNCWPSNSEKFSELNIDESFLAQLCSRIDDGAEPVVTQVNQASLVAAHLATEQTNCGYVILALPQSSPESTLQNIDLIEILLNQVVLIAKLIEKNSLLYELQDKHYSMYGRGKVSSN